VELLAGQVDDFLRPILKGKGFLLVVLWFGHIGVCCFNG